MHQDLMQLIIASMSNKKDSAAALVVGSSLIVKPGSLANIAPEVMPSTEVEARADMHMREVSQSPLRLHPSSPAALLNLPSHSQS